MMPILSSHNKIFTSWRTEMQYNNGSYYTENDVTEKEKEWFDRIVISFAEQERVDLLGIADTILDVVEAFWRFGRMTNIVIGTAAIVIGVCYVANRTQQRWDAEKERVLAKYPSDEKGQQKRKEARAQRVAEIFVEEAMLYFVGEWVGYAFKSIKDSPKWGAAGSFISNEFLDYLRKKTQSVTMHDIRAWGDHLADELLHQNVSPGGSGW